MVKFIYSEKATKFCEISNVDLTVTTQDKSTVEILQNFVAKLILDDQGNTKTHLESVWNQSVSSQVPYSTNQ